MSQTPFLRNLVSLVHSPKAGSESPAYLRSFKNEGLWPLLLFSSLSTESPKSPAVGKGRLPQFHPLYSSTYLVPTTPHATPSPR